MKAFLRVELPVGGEAVLNVLDVESISADNFGSSTIYKVFLRSGKTYRVEGKSYRELENLMLQLPLEIYGEKDPK